MPFWSRQNRDEIVVYAPQAQEALLAASLALQIRIVSQLPENPDFIAVLSPDAALRPSLPRHVPVVDAEAPDVIRRLSEAILYLRARRAING
ncbi:hypothetical protein [Bryobacter aggregatus]|uniref:hypothetical protein n=1 Tax=Bryobacter aggregatus TaxID=360054 RepID=UPI0004E2363B|nr:hypothetical protein [Bryobacter aggregatus]